MTDELTSLPFGQTVDGSLLFSDTAILLKGGSPSTGWTPGSTGYAGFSFDNAGTTNYGWIQIQLGAGLDDFTVIEFAYDTTGAPIGIGSVPEPGTAILLALGLAGLSLFSRKRPSSRLIDATT
jgi:hypothetical protein